MQKVGGNHNENLKKDIWSMFSRIRNRNITSIIFTNNRMVIFNRHNSNISRDIMVALLKKEVTYDYCSKKSSKMFKRNSKIIIWNKRLIE